ncbi:hypothetical protein [Leifsonia shinshuensis]|uniref:Uncharacterized protein n=1 Tax=Leifsonia shinshuensis TaxID=150026 RepID=A0A7G6YA27_9MICO|nr:hypothetical protein [Leifsonia shinshuensis]QNE35342.1 hypothetical protein F1C12_09520 [Leifsonia shinshuensis]
MHYAVARGDIQPATAIDWDCWCALGAGDLEERGSAGSPILGVRLNWSRYILDLDLELLTRIRGTEQPADQEVAFPSKLRDHDRGAVRLLRVAHLKVGDRAVFDIESLSANPLVGFTRGTSTYVLEIRQL